MLVNFLHHFLTIFTDSAPWLLLGFFFAGLIKAFVPTAFLHKHLGNDSATAVIKGALLGAPLPLCSCGVIPVALGIRRAGASKAATTSFLIATPETGVDSVSITYALLGPFMALIRPIAAVTTAISAGLAVLWLSDKESNAQRTSAKKPNTPSCCSSQKAPQPTSSCCSQKDAQSSHRSCGTKNKNAESNCCSSKKTKQTAKTHSDFLQKIRSGLSFTFVDLIKDTVVWILTGLCLAALIMTLIPPDFLARWGASPYAYLVMALIGAPMYICAVASTPVAAGLLFAGVSPGAVLIFLLIGPATNIATLAIVKNELGSRVLTIYLSVIIVLSFIFGWLTDSLATQFAVSTTLPSHSHEHFSIIGVLSAVLLAIVLANGLIFRQAK